MSDVLPYWLALGVEKSVIDISSPAELKPYEEANKLRIMQQDMMNWYNGMYTFNAVITALDNAFGGKNEYLEEPLLSEMNLTEEERFNRKLKKALAIEAKWAANASYLPDNV